jgi:hypothetical protein
MLKTLRYGTILRFEMVSCETISKKCRQILTNEPRNGIIPGNGRTQEAALKGRTP